MSTLQTTKSQSSTVRHDENDDGGVNLAANADAVVDARGHRCPMPLLMAKRGLNGLDIDQTLLLISTDPASHKDFEIFARQSGHAILQSRDVDDEFHFLIQKR